MIAKELTKLHEQFLRGNAAQLLARLKDDPALTKGEFVVLVDNSVNPADKHLNTDDVEEYSIWKLMSEINSPEIKRGFGFLISFLKNVSDSTAVQNNLISE